MAGEYENLNRSVFACKSSQRQTLTMRIRKMLLICGLAASTSSAYAVLPDSAPVKQSTKPLTSPPASNSPDSKVNSASLLGRWRIEDISDGVMYSGEMVVNDKLDSSTYSASISLSFRDSQGQEKRIKQQARIRVTGNRLRIEGFDASVISGGGGYNADNWDLDLKRTETGLLMTGASEDVKGKRGSSLFKKID